MNILMVDDNQGDHLLMKKAFQVASFDCNLQSVFDGVQAMQYLNCLQPYENAVRPNLILLDLNLPRKDGREVLAEVKKDEKLKNIPVLILSNSHSPMDVYTCYQLHANCYLPKPEGFQELIDLAKSLKDFWFSKALTVKPDFKVSS